MTPEGSNYIERIEALQREMPSLESLVSSMHGTLVEYEVTQGFAIGYGLLNEENCAVQKYYATGSTEFAEHMHEEYEYFIVVQGCGDIIIDGEVRSFQAKDCIVIKPGQVHSWRYETPVKMIAIAVPASKGFPDGKG